MECPKCHTGNAEDSRFCSNCATPLRSSQSEGASPTKTLEIPLSEIMLVTQLKKYRRGKRTGDDLVDALAFSCYEPAEPLESRISPTVLIL